MKFYLMWANHDANTLWDRRNAHMSTNVWEGKVNFEQFQTIGRRWITQYFGLPCYYRIDGKPVVSIYDVANFINGLGGVEQAQRALLWLQEEAKKAGHPGVHVQMIKRGDNNLNLSGVDGSTMELSQIEAFQTLGFDSCTHYQYVHFAYVNRNYSEIMPDVLKEWDHVHQSITKEYYPHVSAGWDNNPRHFQYMDAVVKNNTPEEFEKALRQAKAYVDANNTTPLITINSWNEWTETSYLEPDTLYGYGYLQAIKKVFG